jgi:Sulfotransferase domain
LLELQRLADHHPDVPCIRATHDDDAHTKAAHAVQVDKSAYRGARVILLVRDPRDVIVPLYHRLRHREEGAAQVGSLAEFVCQEVGGIASLLRFYDGWAGSLDVPAEILVLRYEDLHTDPHEQLRGVLEFVGISVDPAIIDEAIRYGSFEHMRRLEETDELASWRLRPVRRGDFDTYKTRKGRVGSHREELSPEDIDRLDHAMRASKVARFGYHV